MTRWPIIVAALLFVLALALVLWRATPEIAKPKVDTGDQGRSWIARELARCRALGERRHGDASCQRALKARRDAFYGRDMDRPR